MLDTAHAIDRHCVIKRSYFGHFTCSFVRNNTTPALPTYVNAYDSLLGLFIYLFILSGTSTAQLILPVVFRKICGAYVPQLQEGWR